jgi:hypothetical protein
MPGKEQKHHTMKNFSTESIKEPCFINYLPNLLCSNIKTIQFIFMYLYYECPRCNNKQSIFYFTARSLYMFQVPDDGCERHPKHVE